MSELVIETHGLHKTFSGRKGKRVAVNDLNLAVPAGGVHGFLGPNGSGKTTTIRMLLGLSVASAGTMRLFGKEVPKHLGDVLPRVGAVVESPKFSPTFTGRQNLLLLARSIGQSRSAVDEALATVSLLGREEDRFSSYSLGMKQRLAIAATLIKKPDLLILDEPTNGLDPAGIREIRETIRNLGRQGVTVLLSSHILAEVQQVCDSATIIGHGRMLASGRVEELIGTSTSYRVTVAEPARAAQVLTSAGYAVEQRDGDLWVQAVEDAAQINKTLADAGLFLAALVPQHADLESVFLQLTEESTLGHGPDLGAGESPRGNHRAPVKGSEGAGR